MGGFPSDWKTAWTRRKPLHQALHEQPVEAGGLRRSLTALDLILYGVGGSVGAGIYALVGIGAQVAGPGIAVSFLSCGIACVFTSLAYAEFAARIPVTGSAYTYAYVAFGEVSGWLVGWFLTLGYGFTASAVARAWAEYFASFLRAIVADETHAGMPLPYLTRLPLSFVYEGYTCSPLSVLIIVLCSYVLVRGVKDSSAFNNFMTFLNLLVLAFVVVAGLSTETVVMDNLTPFFPQGVSGVAQGAGLVFFSFIGFDMVACLSEEVRQPERNMPIGIVGSLLICTAIYVTVSVVVVGMAPIDLLGGDVPITNALFANACCTHEQQLDADAQQCLSSVCSPILQKTLYYGGKLVSFGAIFGLTSGTFTSLMGQPRIFYRMAQDGLLFDIFGRTHPVTQVPTAGIILTGVMTSILACFVDLEALANLISLGTLLVFTFVNAGVICLRLQSNSHAPLYTFVYTVSTTAGFVAAMNKSVAWVLPLCGLVSVAMAIAIFSVPKALPPSTFQCPLVPLVPLLGISSNAYMMGSLPLVSWAFATVWLVAGIAVYCLYGIRHSKLRNKEGVGEAAPLTSNSATYDSTLEIGLHHLHE